MDGLSKATTESRASGQRKVLSVTAGAGVAALAVTGLLTVGLGGSSSPAAAGASTTTTTSSDATGSSGVSSSGAAPVVTSGGS